MTDNTQPDGITEESLSNMSDADLSALTASFLATARGAEPEPEQEAPIEAEVEEVIPEQPEPDESTFEPSVTEKGRIRLEGKAFKFATLVKAGVSDDEAYALAYGKPVTTTDDGNSQEPTDPVQALEEEIAQLKQRRKAAWEEDFLPEVAEEVDGEIEVLLKKRQDLVTQKAIEEFQQQSSAAAERAKLVDDAVATAIAAYPEINQEGTQFCESAKAVKAQMERMNDPRLNSPDLILIIANTVAQSLNVLPSVNARPAQPTSAPKPVARQTPKGPSLLPTVSAPIKPPTSDEELFQLIMKSPEADYALTKSLRRR